MSSCPPILPARVQRAANGHRILQGLFFGAADVVVATPTTSSDQPEPCACCCDSGLRENAGIRSVPLEKDVPAEVVGNNRAGEGGRDMRQASVSDFCT